MQSEISTLLKQLNESIKKVSNSEDEVKEQYTDVLEVRGQTLFLRVKARVSLMLFS